MNMIHCLFWKQDNKLACVRHDGLNATLIKPQGEIFVPESPYYWKNWKNYTGYLRGKDEIDFCLIYEDEFSLPEEYEEQMLRPKFNFWTEEKIRECLRLLKITENLEMVSPEGNLLARIKLPSGNTFLRKTMRCRKASLAVAPEITANSVSVTPFTAHYLNPSEIKHKITQE